jgi:hypothetical protein
MKKIEDVYGNDLEFGTFYIFPMERLDLKNEESIGNVRIFPKGMIDIDDMFSNTFIMSEEDKERFDFNVEVFKLNSLAIINDHHYADYPGSVSSDVKIINTAISKAAIIIDYIKFEYCSLVVPKNMPARLGQVSSGETLLLMYDGKGSPFTRIIDTTIYSNTLTAGVGLEVKTNVFDNFNLLNDDVGEVGNVAKQALRMYCNALEENDSTGKFIEIMRLFEFIAAPDSFEKFQRVRAKIASHLMKNSYDEVRLRDEFKYFSSGDNEDGLRTEIIHNGKGIEVLIPDPSKQSDLFIKLQEYVTICIKDLITFYNKSWSELEGIREDKVVAAKKNRVKEKVVIYAKTVIIIDGNFLSDSINSTVPMYSRLYPENDFNALKIESVMYEALNNCRHLERDKTYKVKLLSHALNDIPFVRIPIASLDSVTLKINGCSFEIVASKLDSKKEQIKAISTLTHEIFQDTKASDQLNQSFHNVIFIGDDPGYIDLLNKVNEKGNRKLTIIKCPHKSLMEHRIQYFDVAHLVGMSFGLSASEL